jgi:hypothetical protein
MRKKMFSPEQFEKQIEDICKARECSREDALALAVNSLWNHTPAEEKPALGVRGVLLVIPDRTPTFRVYNHPAEYRIAEGRKKGAGESYDEHAWDHEDYEVVHYDFDVIIDEKHASLFRYNNGHQTLDYSTESMKPTKRAAKGQSTEPAE